MRIDKINSQSNNFKSRFIPNGLLEQSFDGAARESDRTFVKSIRAVLNDGKDDVLEIKQKNNHVLGLYVNDKPVQEGQTYLNYYGNAGTEMINKYAAGESEDILYNGKYNMLTEQEINLVKEDVDVIQLLAENFKNGSNFIDDIQKTLNNIKKKLDKNTTLEIQELKRIIFNK